jgi:hypothetical protein
VPAILENDTASALRGIERLIGARMKGVERLVPRAVTVFPMILPSLSSLGSASGISLVPVSGTKRGFSSLVPRAFDGLKMRSLVVPHT